MQEEVRKMKKDYLIPSLEIYFLSAEDILTLSDNDAPFLPPLDSPDDGWSGYH